MLVIILYGKIWKLHILEHETGWWYTYLSEKYEFVSWDDYSIPN